MQWLFDIVVEMVRAAGCYVDRGDPAGFDFVIGDLTLDNAWHDLDLSSIVPVNAHAVSLKVNVRANILSKRILIQRKGLVQGFNNIALWTQIANVTLGGVYPVSCDSDRVIQYKAPAGNWTIINLVVNGWWF